MDTYDIVEVLAEIDHEIASAVFDVQREHEALGHDELKLIKRLRMILKRNEGLIDDMIEGYGITWN